MPATIRNDDLVRELTPDFLRRNEFYQNYGVPFGCRVIATVPLVLMPWPGTYNTLAFDTEIEDNGDCWAIGDPDTLYAPVAGYYVAGGGCVVENDGPAVGAVIHGWIGVINGTTGAEYARTGDTTVPDGAGNFWFTLAVCTGMFWLNAGDGVNVNVGVEADALTLAADVFDQHNCFAFLMRAA